MNYFARNRQICKCIKITQTQIIVDSLIIEKAILSKPELPGMCELGWDQNEGIVWVDEMYPNNVVDIQFDRMLTIKFRVTMRAVFFNCFC